MKQQLPSNHRKDQRHTDLEVRVARIKDRARHLYEKRQMFCSEAVVLAINRELGGGLSDPQAMAISAPFSQALGDSGCVCGALSGAVMASGLLLGQTHAHRHRQAMRNSARQLYDRFKAVNGASCCWVLSKKFKHDKKAHFHRCADLTAQAAEMAARLVLQKRPELIALTNTDPCAKRKSTLKSRFFRCLRLSLR